MHSPAVYDPLDILSVLVRSCDTTGKEQERQQQNDAAPLRQFKIGSKHVKGLDSCFRFLNLELYIYLNMLWVREFLVEVCLISD